MAVISMFTGEVVRRVCLSASRGPDAGSFGFTLMEVLVGIALTLLLAVGVGPLVLSIERQGVQEGDRSVAVLQGRVAAARLERDLRSATAYGCPFETSGPVLEAGPRQVVFLSSASDPTTLLVVEWELAGSTLMRRWGTCPTERLRVFPHAVYLDSKTMLEGLDAHASFSYVLSGAGSKTEVAGRDLSRIEVVGLSCDGVDPDQKWPALLQVEARVGR